MTEELKETKKSTTTRKPKTAKKVDEPVGNDLQAQMQQMMQMMAQQQQMFMTMMQGMAQTATSISTEVEVATPKKTKVKKSSQTKTSKRITKQSLRRTLKDTEIYLINNTVGSLSYSGKNEDYIWDEPGESVPVSIHDLLSMNENFLKCVMLDEEENEPEVLEAIIEGLELQEYEHLFILNELEDDVNGVSIERVAGIVSTTEGKGLISDIAIMIQNKIENGELTNTKAIKEYEKILHKNFKK